MLERRAAKLKSRLHAYGDLRKQMKKQRAGREAKLSRMMEPTSEEGGGSLREGAALSNGLRKGRDGAVDSVVIREEVSEACRGAPRARAATSGEEVKKCMGWGRAFWFHNPSGVTPKQPMDGVLHGAVA